MSTAAYHYILLPSKVSEVSPFVSHGAIRTPPSSSSHNFGLGVTVSRSCQRLRLRRHKSLCSCRKRTRCNDLLGYCPDQRIALPKTPLTFLSSFWRLSCQVSAKEEAVRAVIEFVKSPDMFQQLEKDAKYASVYQLLKIFLPKRLDAYLDFHSSNSNLLDSHGLVHEDCITKMKLICLVDVGKNESGQIPYSLIKETLQV
ncbi:hypothetical protein OROHE_007559 [Orobanche hederae]